MLPESLQALQDIVRLEDIAASHSDRALAIEMAAALDRVRNVILQLDKSDAPLGWADMTSITDGPDDDSEIGRGPSPEEENMIDFPASNNTVISEGVADANDMEPF